MLGAKGSSGREGFSLPWKAALILSALRMCILKCTPSSIGINMSWLEVCVCVFIIKRAPCNIAWPYFCSHLKWMQNRETEQALPSPQHFRCKPRHLSIGMEALLLAEFLQPQFPNVDTGLHSFLLKFSLTHRISSCVVRCSRHRL